MNKLAEIEQCAYGNNLDAGTYYGPCRQHFEWLITEINRLLEAVRDVHIDPPHESHRNLFPNCLACKVLDDYREESHG